jgi:hypothetical protein
MTTLVDMHWGYFLGLSGVLGLDRNQVTDMAEALPDEAGSVLITWWALADQEAPVMGEDMGEHLRLDESPEQWTGSIRLSAQQMAELRPQLGTLATQDDADYFDAGEPDEDGLP